MILSEKQLPLRAWRTLAVSVAALLVWDVAVTFLYLNDTTHFDGIDIQFTLFGTAIALFVGFMVNASYGRWWEARTLWGQVVNSSRSLARQALVLVDQDRPDTAELARQVVRNQVAYVHVLRTSLRGQPLPPEAGRFLGADRLERVARAANRQTAILLDSDRLVTEAQRRGGVGELARLELEAALVALTDAQGGLERIQKTPLPVQYRFLPRFFSRVFCLILPFAVVEDLGWLTPLGSGLVGLMFLMAVQIGDQLANPFADDVYDVPMTAMTRTIEIDLVQMLGDEAPGPVTPVEEVLY
ncbi:putative membrane protein [Microlunatus sagamiharensis]|uniref:Putative membrane protein n=1 Tax=Microlunatus sagamiharensis TaxID=546874 RepID=A0A1H2MRB4_9ACTN|nr:bestrophin family ion channel [Microlunatus sagamiharensis]SDU95471.1 putative membrane protein [Microlunatus sagamiharensis]